MGVDAAVVGEGWERHGRSLDLGVEVRCRWLAEIGYFRMLGFDG